MNRSFRSEESALKQRQQQHQMGNLRKEKDEELTLFLEMRRREMQRNDLLLLHNSDEFDVPLGVGRGSSPIFDIPSATPAQRTGANDFLSADNDKNDYDWLLTPPGTPLFPSLEMESQKTVMSKLGTHEARPAALKSRGLKFRLVTLNGLHLLSLSGSCS